jgi:hypothetical protein
MAINQSDAPREIFNARRSAVVLRTDDFDYKGWKTARPINLKRYWSGEAAPASRHAEVRAVWSAEALHLLYDCQQQEPLVVVANPQTETKTIGLWDRDVCEAFIAPDPARPDHYFEFEGAPTGEWLDVGIRLTREGRQSDWRIQSGLAVAAKVAASRVLVSLRIPWSPLVPRPQAGTSWRANFFRCVGSGEDRGYLAWQPTFTAEPSFHVSEVFGYLRFE